MGSHYPADVVAFDLVYTDSNQGRCFESSVATEGLLVALD